MAHSSHHSWSSITADIDHNNLQECSLFQVASPSYDSWSSVTAGVDLDNYQMCRLIQVASYSHRSWDSDSVACSSHCSWSFVQADVNFDNCAMNGLFQVANINHWNSDCVSWSSHHKRSSVTADVDLNMMISHSSIDIKWSCRPSIVREAVLLDPLPSTQTIQLSFHGNDVCTLPHQNIYNSLLRQPQYIVLEHCTIANKLTTLTIFDYLLSLFTMN